MGTIRLTNLDDCPYCRLVWSDDRRLVCPCLLEDPLREIHYISDKWAAYFAGLFLFVLVIAFIIGIVVLGEGHIQ